MSADDTSDGERGDNESVESHDSSVSVDGESDGSGTDVRDRLEQEADRALDQFDEGLIDLLSWILETDTRARIYVHLRQHPDSTSEEIAEGTGLYPSTVREALASLHEEKTVSRSKRQNAGAGNNPYEYSAIPPSDLVSDVVDDVQRHLNTVFNLDRYLDRSDSEDTDPVTITVTEESDETSEINDNLDGEAGDQSGTEPDDDQDESA
jgi:predicted transcriptional regulator